MTVEVSVVVPTFNRPLLDRCLAGLVAQAFDRRPTRSSSPMTRPAIAPAVRSRIGGAGSCRRDRPSTTCRCATRTVRPPPAMRVAIRTGAGDRLHRRRLHSRAGMAAAGTRAIRDGATGVSGRVVVPYLEDPTDYERNAAGWRPPSSSPRTASISGRRSRLSAGSTSVSPWPGGRIAISG